MNSNQLTRDELLTLLSVIVPLIKKRVGLQSEMIELNLQLDPEEQSYLEAQAKRRGIDPQVARELYSHDRLFEHSKTLSTALQKLEAQLKQSD